MNIDNAKICIIGLGYVGLPLAIEFGKKYHTVGFDINHARIESLNRKKDITQEVESSAFDHSKFLKFTSESKSIIDCNIYIITVPTPVDIHNKPDLSALCEACKTVGKALSKGDLVIIESTVYPGTTEEICVPILEAHSGLKFNSEFFCGYSPERLNPGDKSHTVSNLLKVTSGSTPDVARRVNELYSSIVTAGTHLVSSIRVAEAAKVIENAQRDINIAFVNELSKIFSLLGLDTTEVLQAAGTKWNFLKFQPGLVGGHCIGVDPYYLAQKAQEVGYHPEIILAGRRLNDSMGTYIADETVKLMVRKQINVHRSQVLILGITFKENCPDVRNTKVVDIIRELKNYHIEVTIVDPWASKEAVHDEYGLSIINDMKEIAPKQFDGLILAVAHHQFKDFDIKSYLKSNSVVYDVKSVLPKHLVDKRL